MALRVLDGNQTATTLSSVVTGGEHIVAHSVVSLGANAIANITSAVSGSVVSISNFPSTQTIAGTVTANLSSGDQSNPLSTYIIEGDNDTRVGNTNPLPISGTVTANGGDFSSSTTLPPLKAVNLGFTNGDGDFLQVGDQYPLPVGSYDQRLEPCGSGNPGVGVPNDTPNLRIVGGFVSASVTIPSFNIYKAILVDSSGRSVVTGSVGISNSVTIGSLPAISGTVTANNPSGALTTRFGSVTTASVAEITSAVTNTSRKYLLAQNISAGTVTIGIGFSPTTTQGIQLTAGGGLTFDAFCPTGAIFWLGAVTGAAFTILEG